MPPFVSKFTGPEIDKALKQSLGNIYGDELKPGTRLVGEFIEDPIDLNELRIPGQYTSYFYLHGPKQLAEMNGNTPISISVFKNANPELQLTTGDEQQLSLWQTIIALSYATESISSAGINAGDIVVNFFYRDLMRDDINSEGSTSEGYGWQAALMTSGNTTVINNLRSSSTSAALSANMGRYLKKLIDEDDDGVLNLLPCSLPAITAYKASDFFSNHWEFKDENGMAITPTFNTGRDKFHSNGNFDPVGYFKSLLNDDYVQLSANTANNPTVGYVASLKTDYFVKIRPTDKAYTASIYVRMAGGAVPVSPWVRVQLYSAQNADKALTKSLSAENTYETDTETNNLMEDTVYPPSVIGTAKLSIANEPGSNIFPWTKITATIEGVDLFYNDKSEGTSDNAARYIGMSFGFNFAEPLPDATQAVSVQFAHAKLERGKIATDSALTYAEMWHEFNNANYLNSTPIAKTANPVSGNLKDSQGLIYNNANSSWVNRYITSGGGGGFVAQAYPPDVYEDGSGGYTEYDSTNVVDRRKLLWYVYGTGEVGKYTGLFTDNSGGTVEYNCYEGSFYFYDGKKWAQCESIYTIGTAPPVNTSKLWLDTGELRSNYNASYGPDEPADLKYFDPNVGENGEWRVVGAEPKPAFVIQDTEPTGPDADLMWITTKGVASVPYWKDNPANPGTKIKTWLPIQAIWGHNSDT